MYDQHVQQSMDQPGKVANPARGVRSRLRIWSVKFSVHKTDKLGTDPMAYGGFK